LLAKEKNKKEKRKMLYLIFMQIILVLVFFFLKKGNDMIGWISSNKVLPSAIKKKVRKRLKENFN
jgi:predicted PurR-regulated permease PerM